MSRILYFSTVFRRPVGGVRTIFRHVEELRRMGFDAYVLSSDTQAERPGWFVTDAPILNTVTSVDTYPDDIVVYPEVGDVYLEATRRLKLRKVLFLQNQYGMFEGLGKTYQTWAEAGVEHAMYCSGYIARLAERCFSFKSSAVIRCPIDRALYRPRPKRMRVCLMPRKRRDDVALIRKIFERRWPQYADLPWYAMHGQTEEKVAEQLGDSAVFLSLSWREGLGLPPLEAMSAGCLVAGFTGLGGKDYATRENGFWVEEDDVFAAADALGHAIDTIVNRPEQAEAVRQAGFATVARYSLEGMRDDLRRFWTPLAG